MVETTFSFITFKWLDYGSSGYKNIKGLWKTTISAVFRWAKDIYRLDDGNYLLWDFWSTVLNFLKKSYRIKNF